MTVVLATHNPHKVAEVQRILHRLPIELVSGREIDLPEVEETGETFAENALLKARACTEATGLPAIADDSGLAVEALGGMPGVLSARWSGKHGDDLANLELVLAQLADTPDPRRGAAFVCAAALATPTGTETVVTARWPGTLTRHARGTNGFGYDPIFVPAGHTQTSAELPSAQKDALSHRGQALRLLIPQLSALLRP
jgi:XTP/dITP diphosphohydrolase